MSVRRSFDLVLIRDEAVLEHSSRLGRVTDKTVSRLPPRRKLDRFTPTLLLRIMIMAEKNPSSFKEDPYYQNGQPGPSSYDAPPSYDPNSAGPSRLALNDPKSPPPLLTPDSGHAFFPTFAPSPDGTRGPELPGDNPKGFMGHVKNFAPGKAPKKLLDPPPASFLRAPAAGLPYGVFPPMALLSKGSTLDRGFPYAAPECGVGVVPHPFVAHDVNEQDWRQFLHDVRVAGSLSPMNRVVSGLAPLALPGVGIIFGELLRSWCARTCAAVGLTMGAL